MRRLAALASASLALCFALDASAYCLASPKGTLSIFPAWKAMPVEYRVSDTLTDAKIQAAIDAAFTAWGSVPCSKLSFKKGPSFTPCFSASCASGTVPFMHQTNYIYVFWVTTASDLFINTTDPSKPYSSHIFYWQDSVSAITGASIAINAKDYQYTGDTAGCTGATFDAMDAVMPLIGGVSGLATSDYAPSVMDGVIKYCSTAHQTLTADDKNAIYYHYSDGSCPAVPQPSLANGCAGGPTNPPAGDGTTPLGGDDVVPRSDGGTGPASEAGLPIARDSGPVGRQCVQTAQCNNGELCDDTGHCVKSAGDDSGCCRVSHAGNQLSGASVVLGALLLLFAVGLRRRRR